MKLSWFTSNLLDWLLKTVVGIAILTQGPVLAFAQTPEPPTVQLGAPQFDAGREAYLLYITYTGYEILGSLDMDLISSQGIRVFHQQVAISQNGKQTIELEARDLEAGAQYSIEVRGINRMGEPIVGNGGSGVLAERTFIHLPYQVHLDHLRFRLDESSQALVIEVDVEGVEAVSTYRVLLEDAKTHVVELEQDFSGPLPIQVSLSNLASGEYRVIVQALDAHSKKLAEIQEELNYEARTPSLGELLFSQQTDPPGLLISLQPKNVEAVTDYHVTLIERSTNQVALDRQVQADGTTLIVEVGNLPGGSYRVIVRALDASEQEIAAAEGETTYIPPQPPGNLELLVRGLIARPIIPILISLIFAVLVGWSILAILRERQATATPILQIWGNGKRNAKALPTNTMMMSDQPDTRIPSSSAGSQPHLQIMVAASPDKRWVGRAIEITHFPFSIGREECDLNIEGDRHISRRHAELRFSQQELFIVDLLSQNGIYVNGERIAAETLVRLEPNAKVEIRLGRETKFALRPARARARTLPKNQGKGA